MQVVRNERLANAMTVGSMIFLLPDCRPACEALPAAAFDLRSFSLPHSVAHPPDEIAALPN